MNALVDVTLNHGIAHVILNRPNAYNAFDLKMITELAQQLTHIAMDPVVRGVLLAGEGKAFCAGGDLKWVVGYSKSAGASFHKLAAQFHAAILEIRRMRKPVVAAVHGVAAGGGFSLAMACDFRIMEQSATLRQAYSSSGLCIDGGGTFTLPRLVGLARAMEIAAFDQPISSQQALQWGLATQVVADGTAREAAITMLTRITEGSLHAFGWAKRLLTDSFGHSLEFQLELEREGLSTCANHPEGMEGLTAFITKRKPNFSK
ncbi:MAG: enoyl-CoA hydratase-related protein [Desulfobacteraceae bacterium]|nr:enoyl-CoA hydratase-related protein [Desulfobacteraceae bacterium]